MNPSVITTYRQRIRDGLIEPDPVQAMAVEKLQILANRLLTYDPSVHQTAPRGWFGFGSKAARPEAMLQGLYLAGGVGRGKSMLMDLFFDAVPFEPKRRVHFHAFMQEVHDRIRQAREIGKGDPIPPVAEDLAREVILLCFDEFQVTNIADASILGRLFSGLFEAGVIMVATSNRLPEMLYWNGLNRGRFLPFIDLLGRRVDVLSLDGEKDYRLARLLTVDIYHAPLDEGADGAMNDAWDRITGGAAPEPTELEVQGRKVAIPARAMGTARFDFADLCDRPLGAADYLMIAETFRTVMVDRIPTMGLDNRNEAARFVTLIDALYEKRTNLVCSAAAEPDELYPEGDGAFEFRRTASRLHEMRSREYLKLSHWADDARTKN